MWDIYVENNDVFYCGHSNNFSPASELLFHVNRTVNMTLALNKELIPTPCYWMYLLGSHCEWYIQVTYNTLVLTS